MRFDTYYSGLIRSRRASTPTRREAMKDYDVRLREQVATSLVRPF
ncbi:MAG: hypothetical protein WEA81_05485 [Dehalococcoidia bacterium]